MGRIDIILPDELEAKFREEVYKRKGMKRGNIAKSVQEAIETWINKPTLTDIKFMES